MLPPSHAPLFDTFWMGDDEYNLDFDITLPIDISLQQPSASPSQILTPTPLVLEKK